MNTPHKGESPLALIVDGLPVRGRIGVVLIVADLALCRLHGSPDFPVARSAFDLCQRWYDGDRFDPDRFEEAYYDEDGRGVGRGAMDARSQSELAAWSVLASAMMYIAFQAFREIGGLPTPIVSEVREDELDEMYRHMQAISPTFIEAARRAAIILGRGKNHRLLNSKRSFVTDKRPPPRHRAIELRYSLTWAIHPVTTACWAVRGCLAAGLRD